MQKEKIKKIIDKTVALFGFLFFSVFLAGVLIITEVGRVLLSKVNTINSGQPADIPLAIMPLYGIWISIIIILIHVLSFIFIALIVFEALSIFLSKRFKWVVFILAAISLLGSIFFKNNDLFYYSILLMSLLILSFLSEELISLRKRRIKIFAILILFFVLIPIFLPLIFSKVNYRLVISSHDIYNQQDCNNHKEICLNNMNTACELTHSSCYGFSPCGRPMTWGCGIGTVNCNYACPKDLK